MNAATDSVTHTTVRDLPAVRFMVGRFEFTFMLCRPDPFTGIRAVKMEHGPKTSERPSEYKRARAIACNALCVAQS